jgi:hypothetical protein
MCQHDRGEVSEARTVQGRLVNNHGPAFIIVIVRCLASHPHAAPAASEPAVAFGMIASMPERSSLGAKTTSLDS